jgi:tetratricopeptide (TPR) repeat protein
MREREPNHRLAALMQEAGLSNKGLAKRMRDLSNSDGGEPIAPSHTNVDKWVSGETRRPKARTCHVLAKVFTQVLGRPITMDDVGYGEVPAENIDSTLEYPETIEDSITTLTQLAGYELRPAGQADKLLVVPAAWSALLVKWMFGSDGEFRPPEPRPITEFDVQAVSDARTMFANYDYRYGGGRPKPLVAQYLESDVLPLLPYVSPRTELGKEYFREVAALTRLAGWTCYDTGQHALAQRYLYQAFRLARAAGDKPLCGRILAGMSHQANFLGHYEQAVHLARAAAQGANGHATATTMALFHAMEARALSSQGNEPEATAALLAAEKWHSASNPGDDPDWIRYFDGAELHAEFAHCFRDLDQPELASHHALMSIQESESLYVRSLSFCRTVLAESYLQGDDTEQAIAVAKEVVDTAAKLKSYRVISYIDAFRQRLGRQSDSPLVADFDEYLRVQMRSEDPPASRRLTIA